MALRFSLSDFDRAFATRSRGSELRTTLIARAADEDRAIVDFAGVTNVSYSFADEFVGKLCSEGSLRIELANMTPAVARTVERAVERRGGAAARC
jgi:hypothetical protein